MDSDRPNRSSFQTTSTSPDFTNSNALGVEIFYGVNDTIWEFQYLVLI